MNRLFSKGYTESPAPRRVHFWVVGGGAEVPSLAALEPGSSFGGLRLRAAIDKDAPAVGGEAKRKSRCPAWREPSKIPCRFNKKAKKPTKALGGQ